MTRIFGPMNLLFSSQPGKADIQSDLFYDYRTNVDAYPKWQAWMREKQPRLLVIWGKYELSFDPRSRSLPPGRAERRSARCRAGHFALDTAADEIAALVRDFVGSSRRGVLIGASEETPSSTKQEGVTRRAS